MSSLFETELTQHLAVAEATKAQLRAPFEKVVAVCAGSLRAGGKTLFFGNGGSAADTARVADHVLLVPSDVTARIQEMHITLGQMLCAALEIELGLVTP